MSKKTKQKKNKPELTLTLGCFKSDRLTGHDLLNGSQSDIMVSEEHRIGIVLNKQGKGKRIKSWRNAKQITVHL